MVNKIGEWSVNDVSSCYQFFIKIFLFNFIIDGIQNTLICIEMFPISIAFYKAFGNKSFKKQRQIVSQLQQGNLKFSIFIIKKNRRKVIKNSYNSL